MLLPDQEKSALLQAEELTISTTYLFQVLSRKYGLK